MWWRKKALRSGGGGVFFFIPDKAYLWLSRERDADDGWWRKGRECGRGAKSGIDLQPLVGHYGAGVVREMWPTTCFSLILPFRGETADNRHVLLLLFQAEFLYSISGTASWWSLTTRWGTAWGCRIWGRRRRRRMEVAQLRQKADKAVREKQGEKWARSSWEKFPGKFEEWQTGRPFLLRSFAERKDFLTLSHRCNLGIEIYCLF